MVEGAPSAHEFHLDLLEVPLTAEVLGDHGDADDEPPLPFGGHVERPLSSVLYHTVVSWDILSGGTVDSVGALEIVLPDGRPLLRHTIDLVRFLKAAPGLPLLPHALRRLCYAVRPDESLPLDGTLVADCEHRRPSPTYAAAPMAGAPGEARVEIVVRSALDGYVLASEVTHGCSSCFGLPYGASNASQDAASACGAAIH